MKTLAEGATTTLVAALDSALEGKIHLWFSKYIAESKVGHSGAYLSDSKIEPTAEYTTIPSDADKLWRLSERLVGQVFSYWAIYSQTLSTLSPCWLFLLLCLIASLLVQELQECRSVAHVDGANTKWSPGPRSFATHLERQAPFEHAINITRIEYCNLKHEY